MENIKGCNRNLISREVDITMPATLVGAVQMESAQSMVDGPLKNKIAILMSWNYWQLRFAFNLSAKSYATQWSALCQIMQQPSHTYLNVVFKKTLKANQNDLTCLILKLKIHQIFLKNHLMKLQLRIYAANCWTPSPY